MTVPASMVKLLRELTGAPMMECKRALEQTDGNIEEAQRLLREKGIASGEKRAGRETPEGRVVSRVEDGRGTLVAVGCETEPVSKNDQFLAYVHRLLDVVHEQGPDAAKALEDERAELAGKLGENIVLRGAERFEAANGEVVSAYVHPPAEKIGVLVRMDGTPELARLLAMHISFANPGFLARDEVPRETIEREREIYEKLPDVASKPENVRGNIIEGMLGKRFFAESVLLEQAWIHDPSVTVGKALAEHGAEVREFVRYGFAKRK